MPSGDRSDVGIVPGVDVDLAVIVGSPRSGTTWVQRLIGNHPQVASPPETHAFHWYLGPALDRWREFSSHMDAAAQAYERSGEMPDRLIGLQTVLSTEDFLAWSRSLIGAVRDRAFEQKPQARVLLEKTPSNSRRVDDIDLLFPQARFVHVVRDGRDVAASLLAASGSWGSRWAPRDPSSAARMWRSHVRDAERAAALDGRYLAVRYEDMRRDPVTELQRVLSFLDLSATEEHIGLLMESPGGEVLAGDARQRFGGEMPPEPSGFRSSSGRRLPDVAIAEIEKVAGDVLRRYGYEITQTGALTRLRGEVWCAVAPRVRKAPLRRSTRSSDEHGRVGRR